GASKPKAPSCHGASACGSRGPRTHLLEQRQLYTFYNEADGLPYFSARLYSRYVATLAVGSIVVVLTMTTGFWIVAKVGEARGSVKMFDMTIGRRFLDILLWVVIFWLLYETNFVIPVIWVLLWLLMVAMACLVPQRPAYLLDSHA
ncbi:hypothetical protein Tdes44962_MAKER03938, partial [Teratosphaeria destructans]